MKNKVELKKFLFLSLITLMCFLVLLVMINIYEYHSYTKNFNMKIAEIVLNVRQKYPNVSEDEIIEILNNKNISSSMFEKYSIDLEHDSLLLENDNTHYKFMILNILFFILTMLVLIIIFLKFNGKKDKEINKITKCIEEINKKNYKLDIGEISEDELSILKNEIYKTTIMLKEEAENSKKEKLELKDSLSDISHQLKTPLTSILIILDNLIDEGDMDSEVREDFLRDIKREITNINFLVQSILKLSKLDTNTVNFIRKNVYLKDIINNTVESISILCDLRNIKIKIVVNKEAKIKCDFKWQVEAFSNILKNSIEHSKDNSEIKIEIDDNKVYSSIIVEDNGTGIDKDDLPHIFERFYRCKNSTNESIGIGLSLAKKIIEKDNGRIGVYSNSNGTKFIIKYYH